MGILDQGLTYISGLPIFSNWKYIAFIVIGLGYLFYEKFIGRKPFCYVRIKEKRGDSFIDHGSIYKAFISRVVDPDSGSMLTWMTIEGIKKVWKVPKGEDFSDTLSKHKLLELAWFGGNSFQIMKTDSYMYFKEDKHTYKRKKATAAALRVVPEDLKYMDYELERKITLLSNDLSWFDKYLKPYMTYIIVGVICLLMIVITTKSVSKELADTRTEFSGATQALIGYVDGRGKENIDENTARKPDLKSGDGGGG